jgi:hypothetical protein
MNISSMMKQVQKVQEQMAKIQEDLAGRTVEATAGGGMVTVVANGKQEIISVKIAPDTVDTGDFSMLEDMVTAAVNKALRTSKELMQEEITKITGGLQIPGINI